MGERDRHSRSDLYRSSRDEPHVDSRREKRRDERESRRREDPDRSRRRDADREERYREERRSRRDRSDRHRDEREPRESRHRSDRESRREEPRGEKSERHESRDARSTEETQESSRRHRKERPDDEVEKDKLSEEKSERRHRVRDRERDRDREEPREKRHRSSRKQEPVPNRLQMFPFISPAKAPVLAGNTLFDYAVRMKNRIYIGNMGPDITPEDLRTSLAPFGTVVNIAMARTSETSSAHPHGVSRGFCFVDFNDSESAERMLSLSPPTIRIFGRLLRIIEPRFYLDNIEKERFMSAANAELLVRAGVIERISTPEETPAPADV